ncbi:unnamed protein product, partial [Amoebophrya sp. A120]
FSNARDGGSWSKTKPVSASPESVKSSAQSQTRREYEDTERQCTTGNVGTSERGERPPSASCATRISRPQNRKGKQENRAPHDQFSETHSGQSDSRGRGTHFNRIESEAKGVVDLSTREGQKRCGFSETESDSENAYSAPL